VEPPAPDPLIPASDVAPAAPATNLDREPEGSRGMIGRWPFGILVVAVLRLIDAASLIYLFLDLGTTRPVGGVPIIGNSTDLTRALDLVLAALVILGVVGLLLFKRWGWVLTMVLVGAALAGDLIRVAIGEPAYLGMFLHVAAAFYLNGRSVRALAQGDVDPGPTVHA
jgi:hypothetical protein